MLGRTMGQGNWKRKKEKP